MPGYTQNEMEGIRVLKKKKWSNSVPPPLSFGGFLLGIFPGSSVSDPY